MMNSGPEQCVGGLRHWRHVQVNVRGIFTGSGQEIWRQRFLSNLTQFPASPQKTETHPRMCECKGNNDLRYADVLAQIRK